MFGAASEDLGLRFGVVGFGFRFVSCTCVDLFGVWKRGVY